MKQNEGVSIVIPAFNEEASIAETVTKIISTLKNLEFEIIVVNDYSQDQTGQILEEITKNNPLVKTINNKENMGYGASLKVGIRQSHFENIIISDADGTYPIDRMPELIKLIQNSDMVVGSRNGQKVHDAFRRKIGRGIVRGFASFIAGTNIPDINSGLRIFKKSNALKFWRLYPDGFSFTTTITVAHHIKKYKVIYLPIDYYKRSGKSSIRPIKDFVGFMSLVTRLSIYFKPLKVFVPLAGFLFILSFVILAGGYLYTGQVFDVTWAILFISSIQAIIFGLVADMITKALYQD